MFIEPDLLAEIEKRYRTALPLPNPDFHTVVGDDLKVDPRKIFFGINLIRQKMNLPKVDMPKRPLAVSPEQLQATQMLYEPYLPTPPIGIHKIISKQLRLDEWRVHVAIKLIRKSRNLPQWNEERPDLPEAMKVEIEAARQRMADDVDFQKAAKDANDEAAAKAKAEVEVEVETDGVAQAQDVAPVETTLEVPTTIEVVAVTQAPEVEVSPPQAEEAPAPKKRGRPKKNPDPVVHIEGVEVKASKQTVADPA